MKHLTASVAVAAGLPSPALPCHAPPAASPLAAGFPATRLPLTVYGFTEVDGQGILGADFPCSASVLPGACAYANPVDAVSACVSLPTCRAVVVYRRGAAPRWPPACQPAALHACMHAHAAAACTHVPLSECLLDGRPLPCHARLAVQASTAAPQP